MAVVRSADMNSFNPRAREGRDFSSRNVRSDTSVSIHAPVKGATPTEYAAIARCCFNPRAREGRDT